MSEVRTVASRLSAAIAGVLVLAACGQPDAAHISTSEVAAGESRIAEVADAVYGSAAQRSAGERRVYDMFQGGIVDCMASKGFQYDPPGFDDFTVPGSSKTTLTSPWLQHPADSLGVGENARRWVEVMTNRDPGGEAYLALDAEGKNDYNHALDHCQGPDNGYATAQFPDAVWVAIKDLDAIANDVTAAIDGRHGEEYTACMAEAGFHVADYYDLYEAVDGGYSPYRERALAGKPTEAAWRTAEEDEAAAAKADATCRTEGYREAVAMAAPLVQKWADSNADLLASVKQQWRQLEQEYGSADS